MPKINYEDFTEESEQSKYFYGRMSTDEVCSHCGVLVEEEDKGLPYCFHCGEVSWLVRLGE